MLLELSELDNGSPNCKADAYVDIFISKSTNDLHSFEEVNVI